MFCHTKADLECSVSECCYPTWMPEPLQLLYQSGPIPPRYWMDHSSWQVQSFKTLSIKLTSIRYNLQESGQDKKLLLSKYMYRMFLERLKAHTSSRQSCSFLEAISEIPFSRSIFIRFRPTRSQIIDNDFQILHASSNSIKKLRKSLIFKNNLNFIIKILNEASLFDCYLQIGTKLNFHKWGPLFPPPP